MTMCTSTECPMQKECYRAELDRNDCQEYFNFEYTCNENSGFCDFISVKSNRAEDVCEKTINKSGIQFKDAGEIAGGMQGTDPENLSLKMNV